MENIRTLKDEQKRIRENFNDGCFCGACGQFVKNYKRKLNSGMAIVLIKLWRANGLEWVNVKEFLRVNSMRNANDWTLLRHWGFLDKLSDDSHNNELKTSGIWRVTPAGSEFILNKIESPSHIHFFNSKFLGFADGKTKIENCLGNHFSYYELMNS